MKHIRLLPFWIASLLFLYQYISPLLSFNVGIRFSPDRLLLLVILGLFIRNTFGKRHVGTIEWLMLSFTILCVTSWFVTKPDSEGAKLRWLNTIFQLTCFPFLAFYIGKTTEFSDKDVWRLLSGVVIIQSYLAFNGVAEYLQVDWLVWPKYILDRTIADQSDRLTGPFGNSSMLGAALVLNFSCLAFMTCYMKGAKRVYLYLLMFLSLGCVYLTHTRTVWLGLLAVLVVFFLSRTELRVVARNITVLLAIGALTGVGSKFSLFGSTLFSQRQETIEYRVENLKLGLRVFARSPLFGLGYGGFAIHMAQYQEADGGDEIRLTSGNENTWLGILVDTGLVGLALYVAIYASLIRSAVTTLRDRATKPAFVRMLAAVALTMTLYMVLNWSTGDLRFHLYDPCIAFLVNGVTVGYASRANGDCPLARTQGFEWEISEAVT